VKLHLPAMSVWPIVVASGRSAPRAPGRSLCPISRFALSPRRRTERRQLVGTADL